MGMVLSLYTILLCLDYDYSLVMGGLLLDYYDLLSHFSFYTFDKLS